MSHTENAVRCILLQPHVLHACKLTGTHMHAYAQQAYVPWDHHMHCCSNSDMPKPYDVIRCV